MGESKSTAMETNRAIAGMEDAWLRQVPTLELSKSCTISAVRPTVEIQVVLQL